MKTRTAVMGALLMVALSAAGQESMLGNAGFEEGGEGFAPWAASGTASHIGPYEWQHHDGKRAGGIGNDQGPADACGDLWQEVRVPGGLGKGDLVIFSVWVQGEDRYSGTAAVAVEFLDAEGRLLTSFDSQPLSGRFEWTNVVVSGEAPEGATRAVVRCTSRNMAPGKGISFVWFDDARVDCPVITASSTLGADFAPANVMRAGMWHSELSGDQWLLVDSRTTRVFTGLSIGWGDDYAGNYDVLISDDGSTWTSVYAATKNTSGPDTIRLEETHARFIKIACRKSSTGKGFGIGPVRLMGASETMTLKRYYEIMAGETPAYYPRWLSKQEAYWTGVGVAGDENEAILCEDGTIEPHKRGFSIMPFLQLDNRLFTRDDAKISQSLQRGYLPIPSVKWDCRDVEMSVELFASGEAGESVAYAWYRVSNRRESEVSGRLYLAFQPFQVYPPWQGGGGWTTNTAIEYSNHVVTVNDAYRVLPLSEPSEFGAMAGSRYVALPFKTPGPPELQGDIMTFVNKGRLPEEQSVRDTNGFASAALSYDFRLGPGESDDFFVAMPLHDKPPRLHAGMKKARIKEGFSRLLEKNIAFWESTVRSIQLEGPEPALVDMLKANTAFILVTRDGPAFQPGSRSYDKAWMRDGGMTAAALLTMGINPPVREFIDWYSTFQEESGEVPPIIDTKEKDPLWEEHQNGLIEYDSQGEFIYTVLQYYLFTKDRAFLESHLTHVVKALEFLVHLRKQTLTPEFENGGPEKRKYYGILPPSTSHEGYGKEYSYWDDFWGLKGWKDGRTIFKTLGRDDLAEWADKEYADFKKCFYDSMRLTMETAKIDFIPGSASLSDFDATSTAVALMYCDELDNLPQPALGNTFDRYYKELLGRSKPGTEWRIVPYELRSVPALLYMGQKDRALHLLRFMIACRRPEAWNQLAEVVHSDYRFPTYVGDMPHTWVGAEYLLAVRVLFLYERGDELILGAGVDPEWLEGGRKVSIANFPSHFGSVSYEMMKTDGMVSIHVSGEAVPEGGFVFKSPRAVPPREVKVNGVVLDGADAQFSTLPADIVFSY